MFCHQILTTVPKDKNFSCFRDQYSSRGDFTPNGQAANVGGKEQPLLMNNSEFYNEEDRQTKRQTRTVHPKHPSTEIGESLLQIKKPPAKVSQIAQEAKECSPNLQVHYLPWQRGRSQVGNGLKVPCPLDLKQGDKSGLASRPSVITYESGGSMPQNHWGWSRLTVDFEGERIF